MTAEWGPDYLMAEHLVGTQAYGLWSEDECTDIVVITDDDRIDEPPAPWWHPRRWFRW